MSQSATPATQNDMTTASDTSKKSRLCNFSHRHGNVHKFAASKSTLSYEFSMDLLQNRRFVRGVLRFSWHVTKCHACHGICTLLPLCTALTMRFAKTCNTTRPKCCGCHEKISWNCSKSMAPCHTKRLLTRLETWWNATKRHNCHAKRHDHIFWHVQKVTFLQPFP